MNIFLFAIQQRNVIDNENTTKIFLFPITIKFLNHISLTHFLSFSATAATPAN